MRNKFDTYYLSSKKIDRQWVTVDVQGKALGRISSQIASILRGKHKATFQPTMDNGDNVIVLNASKVKVSGRKYENKLYHKYSGYPGGITTTNFAKMITEKPERVLEEAIRRMLPKGRIGRAMYKKLHVYAGEQHEHEAQKPTKLDL